MASVVKRKNPMIIDEAEEVVTPPKKKLASPLTTPLKSKTPVKKVVAKKAEVVPPKKKVVKKIVIEEDEDDDEEEQPEDAAFIDDGEEEEEEDGQTQPEEVGEEEEEEEAGAEEGAEEDESVRPDFEDYITAKQIKLAVIDKEKITVCYPASGIKTTYFDIINKYYGVCAHFKQGQRYQATLGVIIELESNECIQVSIPNYAAIVINPNHFPPTATAPLITFVPVEEFWIQEGKPLFRVMILNFAPILPIKEDYETLQKSITEQYKLLSDDNNIFEIDSI